MEGIRRAIVLGLVLISGTAIEQAPFADILSNALLIIFVSQDYVLPSVIVKSSTVIILYIKGQYCIPGVGIV